MGNHIELRALRAQCATDHEIQKESKEEIFILNITEYSAVL